MSRFGVGADSPDGVRRFDIHSHPGLHGTLEPEYETVTTAPEGGDNPEKFSSLLFQDEHYGICQTAKRHHAGLNVKLGLHVVAVSNVVATEVVGNADRLGDGDWLAAVDSDSDSGPMGWSSVMVGALTLLPATGEGLSVLVSPGFRVFR